MRMAVHNVGVAKRSQHFVTLAECPHCHNLRIQLREGFHFLGRWRCRKCQRMFFFPGWVDQAYPHGTQPPTYAIRLGIPRGRMFPQLKGGGRGEHPHIDQTDASCDHRGLKEWDGTS